MLGTVAALAAYEEGGDWLAACLTYLEANRDFLVNFIRQQHAGHSRSPRPKEPIWHGSIAAKLDLPCRAVSVLSEEARVALGDGCHFGTGGEGFVRLNFGCPRAMLTEGLERMVAALAASDCDRITNSELLAIEELAVHWYPREDLNLWPLPPQGSALSTELLGHIRPVLKTEPGGEGGI